VTFIDDILLLKAIEVHETLRKKKRKRGQRPFFTFKPLGRNGLTSVAKEEKGERHSSPHLSTRKNRRSCLHSSERRLPASLSRGEREGKKKGKKTFFPAAHSAARKEIR